MPRSSAEYCQKKKEDVLLGPEEYLPSENWKTSFRFVFQFSSTSEKKQRLINDKLQRTANRAEVVYLVLLMIVVRKVI